MNLKYTMLAVGLAFPAAAVAEPWVVTGTYNHVLVSPGHSQEAINVIAVVTDENGAAVIGLKPRDFAVATYSCATSQCFFLDGKVLDDTNFSAGAGTYIFRVRLNINDHGAAFASLGVFRPISGADIPPVGSNTPLKRVQRAQVLLQPFK